MQELKETVDAIMADHDKLFQEILDANTNYRGVYWIVLFCKPSGLFVEGKPALMRHMKAYFNERPKQRVGMIIWDVNGSTGEIAQEINMPDIPLNINALLNHGAKESSHCITTAETNTLGNAYVAAYTSRNNEGKNGRRNRAR